MMKCYTLMSQNRPQVVNTPVDYDNRSISDYNEARVSVSYSTSSYLHDTDLLVGCADYG